MPIPTPTSTARRSAGNVDTSQISAYAVYNNLVPGVKVYQDTSESTQSSMRKKSRKKKKAALKNEADRSSKSVSTQDKTSSSVHQNVLAFHAGLGTTATTSFSKSATTSSAAGKKRIMPTPAPAPSDNDLQLTNLPQNGSASKMKKAKKNKKKATSDVTAGKNTSSADPQPPAKRQRKSQSKNEEAPTFLPNPFAAKHGPRVDKNGKNKQCPAEIASASKSVPTDDQCPSNHKKDKKQKGSKSKKTAEIVMWQTTKPATKTKKVTKASWEMMKANEYSSETSVPPDINPLLSSKVVFDSTEHGKALFAWLIHPQSISAFMSESWEKAPLLFKRGVLCPDFYEWILTSSKLDDILRKNVLKYSENVDIVAYQNGIRETISKEMAGRVRPAVLWDSYSQGHSIRILNPQTYSSPLRRLNASLQEMFGCFVGANVYLTPPDAQGFAPHFDDIEAFILQVEGKKLWKLYTPRTPEEVLPRYSSRDLGQERATLGKPFMEVTLEAGDMLYFPRGTIHEAKTVEGFHSMHITLSCYQQNSWADLMKQHLKKAVDKLAAQDVELRRGLPLDYLSFMGAVNSGSKDAAVLSKRQAFKKTLQQLIKKVGKVDADDAADQMGKKFMWDSLPPYLTSKEKDKTVNEDGEFLNNGQVKNRAEVDPDTKIKLVRKNCVRLVPEEGELRLYFSIDNSLVYHEEEPQFIEISEAYEDGVKCLINSYPEFVKVEDLPMKGDDINKIQLAVDLWERGILMTEKPLKAGLLDEDDFDFENDEDSYMEESEDNSEDSDLGGFLVDDDDSNEEMGGGSDDFIDAEESDNENSDDDNIYDLDEDDE